MKINLLIRFITAGFFAAGFNFVLIPEHTKAQQSEKITKEIKIEFGHTSPVKQSRYVKIFGLSEGTQVFNFKGADIENDDKPGCKSMLNCGAGDVDQLTASVTWLKPSAPQRRIGKEGIHMWEYFFENGAPGQVERILAGPWRRPDAPLLTLQLNQEGTEGFTVGLEQLNSQGAMWLPDHDVFIKMQPVNFSDHLIGLSGKRVLDQVQDEPDASLGQFHELWTDFGNPLVDDPSWNDWQTRWMGTTGHLIVTAPAHGSIYKFAIDRWGNARPDYASPHKFRLDLSWKGSQWEEQKIENGLPLVITKFKKNGQTCTAEQFVCPLDHPDAAVQGYIPGALLTSIKFTGEPGAVDFSIDFNNESPELEMEFVNEGNHSWILRGKDKGQIWLMLKTTSGLSINLQDKEVLENGHQLTVHLSGDLKTDEQEECVIWLPSPPVASSQAYRLERLNYKAAREYVVEYWENWLSRGAHFQVPEEKVNELFRANLWHALVLPRHTIGADNKPHMDIPYANTAYGQQNADWPVNQAVYVDYMIYGLRGYGQVAENELAAMFHTQQWENGRIGGYANWGVYSPGHLYAIAQNFLLSRDRESFERLLPASLKTLDWCLAQTKAADSSGHAGLIKAPLNDNNPDENLWAFTQAYFAGGLGLFAKALSEFGHEKAEETRKAAEQMKKKVTEAFARSSVFSPVVQLADGSWINYVPTNASIPRRQVDEWYPTDVDTGPLHLVRLGAVPFSHWLTASMLNDHEDNLFFRNRGAANEPVYLPQANIYLLRDNPKAVIRSFYSMMACAFSHNQLTPLEHRWAHPIYYGPPSTDGAWFEIYRRMLLNERGDDTLFIGQAIPRAWLEKDKKVEVENAPSYFGPISFTIEGLNSRNEINAEIEISESHPPKILKVRFRHPRSSPMRSVMINGKQWESFDEGNETITIANPQAGKIEVKAVY